MFSNFAGKGYSDNGKAIAEALRTRNEVFDMVWEVADEGTQLPAYIRKVRIGSIKWIYEVVTAKVWIDNSRKLRYVRKRKGQFYIQTWHGDIGMKKVEKDAIQSLPYEYVQAAKNDSKMADLFVAGNEWITQQYKNAFWYDGPVAKCGYPRRDILYRENNQLAEMKEGMGLPPNTKVLFYAPTFRKNQEALGVSSFSINWENLLDAARQRFGGNWVGLIRLHPNISHMSSMLELPKNVFDMTNYPDMQELLAISDICISDYSSSAFEFGVTQKPAFIYASDFEDYKNDRDTFFSLNEIPFPAALDEETLVRNILTFDDNQYHQKSEQFYQNRIGLYQEGHASDYLAEVIAAQCACRN